MALTWDELQKNGTDSRTIEEVIDDKIATHDEDQAAHMGDGASLSLHRKDEVVDHPAKSVVLDKIDPALYHEYAANLGDHNLDVEEGSLISGKRKIMMSMFTETETSAYLTLWTPTHSAYPDADLLYCFTLYGMQNGTQDGKAVLSFTDDTWEWKSHINFVVEYYNFYIEFKNDGVVEATKQWDSSGRRTATVEIYFDHLAKEIVIYIDRAEFMRVATADVKDYIFPTIQFYGKRTSNKYVELSIEDWKMSYYV